MSNDEVLALAKRQLGLPTNANNASIPTSYLAVLKAHISIFPEDTNFCIIAQPGTGFGIAVCLEDGCNQARLPLTKNKDISDGGKKDGIGSLMEYRSKSLTEEKQYNLLLRMRLHRVFPILERGYLRVYPAGPESVDSDKEANPLIREVRSLPKSNASRTASASRLTSTNVKAENSPKRVKLEEAKIPLAFHDENRSSGTPAMTRAVSSSAMPTIPSKIVKTEDSGTLPSVTLEETSVKLMETNAQLNDYNMLRRKLMNKRRRSAKENRSLQETEKRIAGYTRTKEHWESILRAPQPKQEPADPLVLNPVPAQPQAGPSNYMAVSSRAAPSRGISPSSPASAYSHEPQITDAALEAMKRDFPPGQVSDAPIASSSNVQLPSAPPTPLQIQIAEDLMFEAMERRSCSSNILNPHSLGGIASLYGDSDDYENPYDTNGDWHGRGRDQFRGPVAKAGDLQQFFQEAGNADLFDGNAAVTRALKKLGLPDLNTPFKDLAVTLMPHQVIGVGWMLDKEKSVNKGGILSDEMGLGKDCNDDGEPFGRSCGEDNARKNSIVAPLALLGQWKLEIEMKTEDRLTVLIYHGSGKTRSKKDLQKYDVVLTTFGTLASEWPDPEAEEKKKQQEKKGKRKKAEFVTSDSEEEREEKKKKKLGIMMTMSWYRVVLDEAQNIRNKRTRVSRAVTELISTYRWCLTGTPITNGLGDAYPLFRFLRITPWHDWAEYNSHITLFEKKSSSVAVRRLQAIFGTCLLRRKKDTLLDGKRLIELPPKDVRLCKLEFTPDERDIYKMVETRSQQVFNKYLRAGTVLKNYMHVLVMLLRLRQVCSHTSLITEGEDYIIDDNLENTNEDKRDELILAQTLLGREFVTKLRSKLKDVAIERMAAEKESQDATVENEDCPVCFDQFTDAVVTPCMHFFCRECINAVLATQHIMDAGQPNRYKPDEHPCPSCRAPICKSKLFSREAFEPTDEDLNIDEKPVKSESKTKGKMRSYATTEDEDEEMPDIQSLLSSQDAKGKTKAKAKGKSKMKAKPKAKPKKSQKRAIKRVLDPDEEGEGDDVDMDEEKEEDGDDDDDDLSDFIVQDHEDEEEKDTRLALRKRLGKRRASSPVDYRESDSDDEIIISRRQPRGSSVNNGPIKVLSKMLPSTKMMHMMESLQKWLKEHPDEKCLKLVSDYLYSKDFKHVMFQGNMSREKRDSAVRAFMKNNGARVMLMSLKCGGVGLNLTRANRVISLDLGWSEAVESQAFDRVHRLGQTRPVVVERLVISNTVEDRVLALQEKKKNLADGSLGEGKGKKIGRLSVRELANLFGLDHSGRLLE
ncbi:SNF2 family N-terminal domain-containing protein [Phellopilus nigrolimitatus]|nr:SNF2 family N-terminal domain-containing protein [Phellopilus nigrolimitatus]